MDRSLLAQAVVKHQQTGKSNTGRPLDFWIVILRLERFTRPKPLKCKYYYYYYYYYSDDYVYEYYYCCCC